MDPYRILNISHNASKDDVRQAYRRLARQYHPDLHAKDPVAQQTAEEQMKTLNWAYQEILSGRDAETVSPDSPPPPPQPEDTGERPPVCPLHAADMVYRCPHCGQLACPRCLLGNGCRLCQIPSSGPQSFWGRIPSGIWLWGPIILGVLIARQLDLPPATIGWGALLYLAILGIGVLRRLRTWGCLLWLVFPYSLILAGFWRLFDSLR